MAYETFRWKSAIYDISGISAAIENGKLKPCVIELGHEFISCYCQLYLDPNVLHPRPPLSIDREYAVQLEAERLLTPILLIHVGVNEGLVSLCETHQAPHYVVGDGNHRLVAAMQRGKSLKGFVLSETDSTRYRTECEY